MVLLVSGFAACYMSAMIDNHISQEVIAVCEHMHSQGLLSGADGNVSVRLNGGNTVLITPSGIPKKSLQPSDLAIIDLEGNVISGNPSSEKWMHLSVFQQCPLARCVIHSHPPTAIAWSIAHPEFTELPANCLSELILAAGAVPIARFARPGSRDMAEAIAPHLPKHRAMILARHGALCWGETLTEALNGTERLEHTARILRDAWLLGGLHELPEADILALKALRQKIGEKLL
jgi:L-fuculose-phosphate aldolase